MEGRGVPSLSIVVPVYDEVQNVESLVQAILEAVRPLRRPFELVLVDDGSRDGTLHRLRALQRREPELVVVALRRNFGQTPALQAGFDRARGDVIVTLDGDLQNDPRDISRLLARIEAGRDVVSGWRRHRRDALALRRVPSWAANALIRRLTGIPIHDQGCALKAYRREVIERVRLYSNLHRFVVVLGVAVGASLEEIEVHHRPRVAGRSKYGLSRVFEVAGDLLVLEMVTRFRQSPLRWFALLGLPFLAGALFAGALSLLLWSASLVLPTVALVAGLVFASCLLAGLLGEAIGGSVRPDRSRSVLVRELGPGA